VKLLRILLLHLRLSRAPIFLLGVYVEPKVSSPSQAVWQESHFRREALIPTFGLVGLHFPLEVFVEPKVFFARTDSGTSVSVVPF
jgi:hypothetical protein